MERSDRLTREAIELNAYTSKIFEDECRRKREEKRRRAMNKDDIEPAPRRRKKGVYDCQGLLNQTKIDLCDCLEEKCSGCFCFPCKKCSSLKCGPVCRRSRTFTYEKITQEGPDNKKVVVAENPIKSNNLKSKPST